MLDPQSKYDVSTQIKLAVLRKNLRGRYAQIVNNSVDYTDKTSSIDSLL